MNGPPHGSNTITNQSAYDMVFKDIIVSSDKRNTTIYPNPNNYSINLTTNLQKIYKAELIEVYIPAATDQAVNITPSYNTFYFSHSGTPYSVVLQAGTYYNPQSVAEEITRLIALISPAPPVAVAYDLNLNRYVISDTSSETPGTVVVNITSANNIASVLQITQYNNESPSYALPLSSGPRIIKVDGNGNLYVGTATTGNYGSVAIDADPGFSNSVLSNVVLTDCRIYLSLGSRLDGDTVLPVANSNTSNNISIPSMFCQIPNNTYISSANVKTLLSQPSVYSSIQFYNPTVNDVNKFDVKWYNENGNLLNILEHCFTIRVYYLQKRNMGTDFSIPVVTNTPSGYIDSVFSPYH
jgi:hypothetical protein